MTGLKHAALAIYKVMVVCLLVMTIPTHGSAEVGDPNIPAAPGLVGIVEGMGGANSFPGNYGYKIPLDLPAGRGVTPQLALSYNSSIRNGWIGMGWDLPIGTIQRSTRFGVNYSANDFTVSGADLVFIGGNEYRMKVEGGFARIRKLSNSGESDPTYWEVTDKNGVVSRYGYSRASRQYQSLAPNPDKTFKWCLDRITDTNGNYATIAYFHDIDANGKDTGQIYIDRIDYSGNSDLSPTNYVKFLYVDRSDTSEKFDILFSVTTAKRLSSIEIYAGVSSQNLNGLLQKKYELIYDTDPTTPELSDYSKTTGRSLLTEVKLYGNDGITSLPSTKFEYQQGPESFENNDKLWAANARKLAWDQIGRIHPMDVNGDGKQDIVVGPTADGKWDLLKSDGTKFISESSQTIAFAGWQNDTNRMWTMDVNGDGKQDLVFGPTASVNRTPGAWHAMLANDAGTDFDPESIWTSGEFTFWADNPSKFRVADVNGDGKDDIVAGPRDNGEFYTMLSDGTQFLPHSTTQTTYGRFYDNLDRVRTMDVNGDGKKDIVIGPSDLGDWYVLLSNGTSFDDQGVWIANAYGGWSANPNRVRPFDYNGDGLMDILIGPKITGEWFVLESTGSSFVNLGNVVPGGAFKAWYDNADRIRTLDVNGDGLQDVVLGPTNSSGNPPGAWYVMLSTGKGFKVADGPWITNAYPYWSDNPGRIRPMNASGNGLTDIVLGPSDAGEWFVMQPNGKVPDLLLKVENGIGGTTEIEYTPSTAYTNTQLPLPVQTVSRITSRDGRTNTVSETQLSYEGGYYHFGAHEFRGFNVVTSEGPVGPNGEQQVVKTWFHQGNDTNLDVNDPSAFEGYMVGKSYRMQILDESGKKLSENRVIYAADVDSTPDTPKAPFFNPAAQVESSLCDGDACGVNTKKTYLFDEYGNVTNETFYPGLTASPSYKIERTFVANPDQWIVGLPASETVSSYSSTTQLYTKVGETSYCYDGSVDCTAAQVPTKKNLTKVIRWNNQGASPKSSTSYDNYGNVVSSTDGKGYVSTVTYDSTKIYPVATTDPLGRVTTMQYYGVDGVPAERGLFGQTKSAIDQNGAVTFKEYDLFGRLVKVYDGETSSMPYGTATYEYLDSGKSVKKWTLTDRTATQPYLWQQSYYDGLGRTYKTRAQGSDNKVIVTESTFDARGTITSSSLPYFEGLEIPRNTSYTYDAKGRPLTVTQPDGSREQACYNDNITTRLDAEGHRKRETLNVYGLLVKVDEYEGVFTECSTSEDTPYATTTYSYDILSNLRFITNAQGNKIEMRYDSLRRKTYMDDPDMGVWNYAYDANNNLVAQTDAKNNIVNFQYDQLNRLKKKDYPTGTDVTYTYDEAGHGFALGKPTTMNDASGTTKLYYDDRYGRKSHTVKTVDGVSYTVSGANDEIGRPKSVTYPDGEVLNYAYDNGGNLSSVGAYASFAGYNALGQAGTQTAGGVTTTYQYQSDNNRLLRLNVGSAETPLLDLEYDYDAVGNVLGITNYIDAAKTQRLTYDGLNRLSTAQSVNYGSLSYSYDQLGNMTNKEGITYTPDSVRPHAVGTTSNGWIYSYDANGNMTADGQRLFAWDYDNRPASITYNGVTTFVYDGNGNRVKKVGPAGTIVYIGNVYEISGGVPVKYIMAGGKRIALKTTTNTYYYHQDHLGSTGVVTDQSGVKVEDIFYKPFGETSSDIGAVSLNHKYTGQELDAETGLYYYNARYYNPALGRFMSADPQVQAPDDPQSFNRYAYVRNNPFRYTDPTGYSWLSNVGRAISKAANDTGEWISDNQTEILIATAIIVGGYYALPYLAAASWGTVSASSMAWGAAAGGAMGGYSASVQGGNIVQGVLVGAVLGAGAGALTSALPVIGSSAVATSGTTLGWAASIGQGAAFGTIQGAAFGAAAGYGGGAGDMSAILKGAGYGAAIGAVTGGALGYAKWATKGNLYLTADKPSFKAASTGGPTITDPGEAFIKMVGKVFNLGASTTPSGVVNLNVFGNMYTGGFTLAGSTGYLYAVKEIPTIKIKF